MIKNQFTLNTSVNIFIKLSLRYCFTKPAIETVLD